VVPLTEYQRRRQDAEGRLLALDGQERELTHDADRQAEAARLAAHAEAFCQRVRQGLEQADFGRKRELLELLIDCVVVTGEAVEIRYAIPVGPEGEREPFCRLRTDYLGDVEADHGNPPYSCTLAGRGVLLADRMARRT
jgi:site-specific DNA recombinase